MGILNRYMRGERDPSKGYSKHRNNVSILMDFQGLANDNNADFCSPSSLLSRAHMVVETIVVDTVIGVTGTAIIEGVEMILLHVDVPTKRIDTDTTGSMSPVIAGSVLVTDTTTIEDVVIIDVTPAAVINILVIRFAHNDTSTPFPAHGSAAATRRIQHNNDNRSTSSASSSWDCTVSTTTNRTC